MYPEELLTKAHEAASAAILAHFQAGNREAPFNRGFAWVTISGISPRARWCRTQQPARRWGAKGYLKGWTFFCPGEWPTGIEMGFPVYAQDRDFHLAGAKAFARVLEEHGHKAVVACRLD